MILSNVNRPLLDKIYPKIMELLKTRRQLFQKQFLVHVIILCTGPTTLFHKTNSKEAIFMWPDMHSFYQIHTFEPKVFLSFSLRKVDHVLRFSYFTVSNCSTFYQIHKFGPILARICEFRKTSNQKLITWVMLVRRFTNFTNSSQNQSEFVKSVKLRTI